MPDLRAIVGVDDQALVFLDLADDRVARNRPATFAQPHGDAFGAVNQHRAGLVAGDGVVILGQQLTRDNEGELFAEADIGQRVAAAAATFLLVTLPLAVAGAVVAERGNGLFQQLFAELFGFVPMRVFQGAANVRAGFAGVGEMGPGRIRAGRFGSQNLDPVTVFQRRRKRHEFAVDLGADTMIADVGVHVVGKIDGGGATRQRDDAAFRGEDIDLVGEQVDLDVFQEFGRVAAVGLDVEQALHPLMRFPLYFGNAGVTGFIEPVRSDAGFRDAVHFLGTDLHFDWRPERAKQSGVQRLVAIRLWNRDVVLELAGDGLVERMQGAQRQITVARLLDHDAETVDVEHFGKGQVLFLHLAIDAVKVLFAAANLDWNIAFGQFCFDRGLDLVDYFLAIAARRFHCFLDHLEAIWMQMNEGDIFQFLKDLVEAEAVGDGGVDFQRFLRDAADFLRLHRFQRTHVVQAVGEFDQDDADIARHRQQHLAEVFRLRLGFVLELNLVQLGDAINQLRHRFAEFVCDLIRTYAGVFDYIVQQGGDQGLCVEMPAGEDLGYRQRMRDVRRAALAKLAFVRGGGIVIGANKGFLIGLAEVSRRLRQDGERISGRHQTAFVGEVQNGPFFRISMPVRPSAISRNARTAGLSFSGSTRGVEPVEI